MSLMDCCEECTTPKNTCPNLVAWTCIQLDQTVPWQITINAKCPPKVDSPLWTIDVNYNPITDTYEIEKQCCPDRLVGITASDTCPWHLRDKLITASPLKADIINQWACETMQLSLDTSLLIDKDEKVSVDWICPAWYLKNQLCSNACSWIKIKQKWCCMDFELDDDHFRWAFVKVYLTSDHIQTYPAWGATSLPNIWYWVENIWEQDFISQDLTWVFTIDQDWALWEDTMKVCVNCDWYYRVSQKWSVDINRWVNAFRKIIFSSNAALPILLDSKYWEPWSHPLNFLATDDWLVDPFFLKQFQIWQSEIFFLQSWTCLFSWGRMDNQTNGNIPAHIWSWNRPWEWKDGTVIVRHAWLSSWLLWETWVVSKPQSWYSRSVEYLWDLNMDRRSCNKCT